MALTPRKTTSPPTLAPEASTTQKQTKTTQCRLQRALNSIKGLYRLSPNHIDAAKHPLPPVSAARLEASLSESPIPVSSLTSSDYSAWQEKGKTVLYLAYGSNLCNETFLGKRGIRPLAQINVQVPELRLTFDLPGLPYIEPCFANTGRRDPLPPNPDGGPNFLLDNEKDGGQRLVVRGSGYHKDRWHKGLIGTVYEVTPTDYAHIIATEGGGSAYHDILVTCYPLIPGMDSVPETPSTMPLMAHTLFAPAKETDEPEDQEDTKDSEASSQLIRNPHTTDRFSRPDPSYAQPSARYLKLITDGAAERGLPLEYQTFLSQIRTYTITTKRQRAGQALFLAIWLPIITALMALQEKLQDKKGQAPEWLAKVLAWVMLAMWVCYDGFFKNMYGDGERSIPDGGKEGKIGLGWRKKKNDCEGSCWMA